jgi:hypothetical protein
MKGRTCLRSFWQFAYFLGHPELVPQPLILALVKTQVGFGQPLLLGAGDLALNQIIEIWQFCRLVEPNQVSLELRRSASNGCRSAARGRHTRAA